MSKKDRTGNREKRKSGTRTPDLGYYVIVTDTKCTERCYFEGLRDSISSEYRDRIVIKVIKTAEKNFIKECRNQIAYDPQYRKPWIVFDRDQVGDFDDIIKKADCYEINVGWSNPCIEIWMFAYFNEMPRIEQSWTCVSEFAVLYQKKTGLEYSKSDENLYRYLCQYGDEEVAFKLAESKLQQCCREKKTIPSQMCPATTVYQLVKEIKNKV